MQAPDVEHDIGRLDPRFLKQAGDHHRLDQVAALGDGNVLVDIGDPARRLGYEEFPRNLGHGVDQRLIGYFVGANLPFDHIIASGGIIGHGNRFLILFRLDAPLFRGGAALTGLISANALKHNGQPWRHAGTGAATWRAAGMPARAARRCEGCGAVLDRDIPARYIRSPSGPVTLHREPAPWRGGRVVMQRTANPYMWVRFPPVPPTSLKLLLSNKTGTGRTDPSCRAFLIAVSRAGDLPLCPPPPSPPPPFQDIIQSIFSLLLQDKATYRTIVFLHMLAVDRSLLLTHILLHRTDYSVKLGIKIRREPRIGASSI